MTAVDAAVMHAVMAALDTGPQDADALLAVARARVPWVTPERVGRAVAALELAGWACQGPTHVTATAAGRIALARSAQEVGV